MRVQSVILTTAVIALLAGCATGSEPDAASTPPVASAPAAPAPMPSEDVTDGSGPAAQPGAYLDYYDGAIAETAGTKVLFFHASWCPKCRALEEDILASDIPDDVTVFKVDFDTATDVRQRYGVTLQTTIVYVDDEGDALAKGVLYDETTLDALLAVAP